MIPSPPNPSDLVPLIIPPASLQEQRKEKESTTSASPAPIAFIFLPGAFLYPKDYSALVEKLKHGFQALFTDKNIPVWLILAPIDWTKLNPLAPAEAEQHFNKAIEDALTTAETAGFTPNLSFSGRIDNIFIGMHSMAVLAASGFVFHRAAGAILLGATLVPTDTFLPSVHTYPRPILHIFGEMDGQAHVCRAALAVVEAAVAAPSLGRKTAARECPVAVIQGMNHAQFSNPSNINYARGDLDPYEKEQKVALEEVAAVIAAFLTAHAPTSSKEQENSSKLEAMDVLEDITMCAARHFTPYLRALGRTAAEDLLMCTEGACSKDDVAHPLAYSFGAERIWFDSPYCAFTAHPGELHVAELFAIRAQKTLLQTGGLPSDVIPGIPVAAVAHTSKQTFIHSQPMILQCKDAPHGLVVKVHVLLQREAYPEGGLAAKMKGPIAASVSPTYALKLKSGEQIAYAIKEMSRSLQNPEQFLVNIAQHKAKPHLPLHQESRSSSGCGSDGCRLSSEVYEEALVLVGSRAREIFQKRGFELIFKENRSGDGEENEKVEAQHAQQHTHVSAWIDTPIILGKNDPDHQQHSESVSSIDSTLENISTLNNKNFKTAVIPSVHVAATKEGPFDEGSSRFAGAVYFKAPSLAWCMEWILVAGLRNE